MKKQTIIYLFLLCLLTISVWTFNLYLHPDLFNSPDAAIYANIARNIVTKKGATVDSTLPFFFTYYPPSPGPWPSPYPLGYPLTIALSFLIFGITELASVVVNGFFFIATLPIAYLLAQKLFNEKVALVASLWYIFNPTLLSLSISGMSEPLFIFLATSTVYLLLLENNIPLFLSGLLTGLSTLTRFQGFLLLPAILGFTWHKRKQLPPLLWTLGGFFTTIIFSKLILPPIAEDYTQLSNHHLWATIATKSVFINGVGQSLEPITYHLILANTKLILKKIVFNIYYLAQGFLTATTPSLIVLYLLSFFTPLHKRVCKFNLLVISLLLTFSLFHLITIFDFRYLHPLLPLIIILAAGTFLTLLKTLNPKNLLRSTTLFTLLFIIIPTFTSPAWGTSIQRSLTRPRKPTVLYLLAKIIENNTNPDDIIVSDRPAHIAWYGNRKSILIPTATEDLTKLDKKIPIDAIFISNYHSEDYPGWQKLVKKPHDFGDFYLAKSFEIKSEENYYRIPVKAVLYLKKEN